MSKMYKYTNPWAIGCEDEIWFTKERYMDGSLAIEAWCEDGPYTMVTVNLSRRIGKDEAFVDTNNNAGIDRWLEKKRNCGNDRTVRSVRFLHLPADEIPS